MSEEASGDSSCAASASASAVIGQADQKTGIPRCIPPKVNPNERYTGEIIDKPGYDIFGQPISEVKKPVDVSCPECGRVVASNRFMQHLEKCMMNMGRQSSRVAEQRIKTGEQDDVYAPDDEEVDEADVEAALAGIEGQNKGEKTGLFCIRVSCTSNGIAGNDQPTCTVTRAEIPPRVHIWRPRRARP
eukprot:scpid89760/ scgid2710/ SAGA-associated factor 11 homolog